MTTYYVIDDLRLPLTPEQVDAIDPARLEWARLETDEVPSDDTGF